MANIMRWRSGDTNPIMCGFDPKRHTAVRGEPFVEIGDLVLIFADGTAVPLHMLTVKHRASQLQNCQVGVAMSEVHASMRTKTFRVATTGVFEYPGCRGIYEVGEAIGPAAHKVRGNLAPQTVDRQTDTPFGITTRISYKNGYAQVTFSLNAPNEN